ncbi:MAG TPA: DUF721 domain-containing protein [candidate division Zixibacteria bacterium]|nr:DUF721 domain-containing protein [candidate division Zixibacteria bacterium]
MKNNDHKKNKPQPISGVIGKIMSSFGISKTYHGWMVVEKWSEIVGKELAQRSKAIRFEDGILYVAVTDDAWRQEISMKSDEIISQIHSYPFGRSTKQIRLLKH